MSEDTKKEVKPETYLTVKSVEKKEAPKKVGPKKTTPKKAAPKKAAPAPFVKRYSFDQWASRRGVKNHHRGGLRAFITNSKKSRTLAEWDACFTGY